MRRNPELAHKIASRPDIERLRHKAIDMLQAAQLISVLLSKPMDAVKEIEVEERVIDMLEDATYNFRTYLREKLKAYEDELIRENTDQRETIDRGNKLIEDTVKLGKQRGLSHLEGRR